MEPTPRPARRRKLNANLAPDVIEALHKKSIETNVPIARILDAAVRAMLGLEKPQSSEDKILHVAQSSKAA